MAFTVLIWIMSPQVAGMEGAGQVSVGPCGGGVLALFNNIIGLWYSAEVQ